MPRLTVVLPVYNHAAYVEEALQSVFAQDYQDFRIIAVDDGSTDGSLDVLQRYQSHITILQPEHGGPAAARNRAIERSDSEYIAFMDADDLAEGRRFSTQVRKLEGTNLDLVASALSFIDEWGWPIPGAWSCPRHARADYWASLLERNWIGTPSVMVRRSALESAGLFDEEFTHAEDYDLWLRVGHRHSIGYVDAPLIQCRRHRNNTSINIDAHQKFEQRALRKVDPADAWQALSRLYRTDAGLDEAWIWFLLRSGNDAFREEAERAIRRNPQCSGLKFALAIHHYDNAAYEQARRLFLGIQDDDAAALHNSGVVAAMCGDLEEARSSFRKALRLRPGYHDAQYNLDGVNSGKKLRITRRPLRPNLVPMRGTGHTAPIPN